MLTCSSSRRFSPYLSPTTALRSRRTLSGRINPSTLHFPRPALPASPSSTASVFRTTPHCFTLPTSQYSTITHLPVLRARNSALKTSIGYCPQRTTRLQAITGDADTMDEYRFPDNRLKKKMDDPSKTPLLLVACGSFSPITFLHLRMFVMAADYVKHNTEYEMIGGYLSPVSDAYKKQGLAPAEHRVAMCQLAIDKASNWLMVDTWEAEKKEYQPTAKVLDHFDHEINTLRKGIDTGDGSRKRVSIALLAGADLIQTMSTPNVWSDKDLDHILGRYGTFIIERSGTDIDEALASLQNYRDNIHVIQQLIQNDVSSTKIRLFLRRGMSVQYLIPAPVVEYIEQNHLYGDEGRASSTTSIAQETDKGKAKESSSAS
ncbi:nicotinate (nicotinamide) nucleotide adenylyltransferase [Exophiala mesophila]|uniref:Nicotinamide-nucleotide adenylyltransferase n=2 Tax=Exophiala mesophila TaxID=212818 RepID=A0A0D1XVB1_EXOME|nr:nicotinate (nicotinamide) nucleotide adenylyltransferase [Exophiala mesophila]KIV92216.1 nicotinate (nicotinamide) nucleotide adenylyltransferase [Exophiala mesophila]